MDFVCLRFPRPITVNKMYANVAGKGRVRSKYYNTWKHHVDALLMTQKPLPKFDGPVQISIHLGEVGVSPAFDCDNAVKPIVDALKRAEVIVDDKRKYVRCVSVAWVPGVDGVRVYVSPWSEPTAVPILGHINAE